MRKLKCLRLISSRTIHWLSWTRKLVPSNDPCSENQEKQSPWQLTTFRENCLITPSFRMHVRAAYMSLMICSVFMNINFSVRSRFILTWVWLAANNQVFQCLEMMWTLKIALFESISFCFKGGILDIEKLNLEELLLVVHQRLLFW